MDNLGRLGKTLDHGEITQEVSKNSLAARFSDDYKHFDGHHNSHLDTSKTAGPPNPQTQDGYIGNIATAKTWLTNPPNFGSIITCLLDGFPSLQPLKVCFPTINYKTTEFWCLHSKEQKLPHSEVIQICLKIIQICLKIIQNYTHPLHPARPV